MIVNLVDNESFKRKLDFVIYKNHALLYFNAGINLYNGQCYVAYPRNSNLYTFDHPSFMSDVEEVSVHSCADADVNGSLDNPEQMFNGNDLAASILANLYQTAISEAITHRKIKFTCGNNLSIDNDLKSYSSILFAASLKSATSDPEYPYEEAEDFLKVHGTKLKSQEAKEHLLVKTSIDNYLIIRDAVAEDSVLVS